MVYILDIQGFQISNEFIVKELSCLDVRGDHFEHYIFKPKFPYQNLSASDMKLVRWLSKHYHGLHWDFGLIDYRDIGNILNHLQSKESVIYVKGAQKIQWLRQWIPQADIINMEDLDISILNFENLRTNHKNELHHCFLHHTHCTTQNVYLLLKHFLDNSKYFLIT